jgi:signal transduction histidine kinase
MRATIDELLVDARGRARAVGRNPADLAAITAEVVETARVLGSGRGVELVIAGAPAVPCRLDEVSVRRALTNLLDNAIRHAPAGSAVEVEVSAGESDASVAVTDHGPGVPPARQGEIFERFRHGDDARAGTGLGLPIARQIAIAHGGSLTVLSPGRGGDGSTFVFTLRR